MLRWILFAVFVLIVELYAFQAVKTFTKIRWVLIAYQAISLFTVVYLFYSFATQFDRSVGQTKHTLFTIGLFLITYIPKILLMVFMFGEDIIRVIGGFLKEFAGTTNESFLTSRRRFVSQIALGVAAIPFLSLLYGMTKGKYNYKLHKKTIYYISRKKYNITLLLINHVNSMFNFMMIVQTAAMYVRNLGNG